MHLTAPVVVIVGLWLDEGVEGIYYLAITHYDDTYRANRTTLIVGRFKIYGSEVSQLFTPYIINKQITLLSMSWGYAVP